jgi:hypothetical protein
MAWHVWMERHGHGMLCVNRPLHGHLNIKQKCPSLRHDRVKYPFRISVRSSSLRCFFDFETPDVFQDLVCECTAVCWGLTAASQRIFSLVRENYLLELEPNFIWESDYEKNGLKRLDTRSLLLNVFCTNRLLVASEKLRGETIASSCVPVRPHGTSRLHLNWFSWNFIFEHFSKIYRENFRCH